MGRGPVECPDCGKIDVRTRMSRRELGERAGVSLPAIASIEHGRRNPSAPCLARLLAALLRAG